MMMKMTQGRLQITEHPAVPWASIGVVVVSILAALVLRWAPHLSAARAAADDPPAIGKANQAQVDQASAPAVNSLESD